VEGNFLTNTGTISFS